MQAQREDRDNHGYTRPHTATGSFVYSNGDAPLSIVFIVIF